MHAVFGDAVAILVGDALQAEAYEVLAGLALAPDEIVRLTHSLARATGIRGMVGGQYADIAQSTADVHAVHAMKTGALFAACTEMGAIIGGCDATASRAYHSFGAIVGQLFQVVDDLLDVTASTEQLGKPAGSDAARDLRTAVTAGGTEGATETADALLADVLRHAETLPASGGDLPAICRYIRHRSR